MENISTFISLFFSIKKYRKFNFKIKDSEGQQNNTNKCVSHKGSGWANPWVHAGTLWNAFIHATDSLEVL